MRRTARIIAWVAAILVGLPAVAAAIVWIGGNTDPGRRVVERVVAMATGGKLTVAGLGGRFPEALTASRVEIHDPKGVWLTVEGATLDWSPLALLHGEAHVEALIAERAEVARPPVSSGGSFSLPVRVAVDRIRVDRLALAAAVAGSPAVVAVSGNLRLVTADTGNGVLAIDRLDKAGRYRLSGRIDDNSIAAQVTADEPAQGLLAGIAHLPGLPGPVAIAASLEGPRRAERARLAIKAGPLQAAGNGTIDLVDKTIDLDVSAASPAMAPRPDLSWRSVSLDAHMHGPMTRPDASGRLAIAALAADGARIAETEAALSGDAGKVDVTATLSGVHLPGPHPDLLAAAPVQVSAEAVLDQPSRPVKFTVSHPVIDITGNADTGGAISGSATVTVPALAPFSALAGVAIQGRAAATVHLALAGNAATVGIAGTLGLTGGPPAAVGLLGGDARFSLAANLRGNDMTLSHAGLDGQALHFSAAGSDTAGVLDLGWKLALSDLSRLAPKLSGAFAANGRIAGPQHDFAVTMTATGNPGVSGFRAGNLAVTLNAQGLPSAPTGRIAAHGQFAGAPLDLDASANRAADGTLKIAVARAAWKSATVEGALSMPPGASLPLGQMRLHMTRLADFAPLVGTAIAGSVAATLDTVSSGGKPQARIAVDGRNLDFKGSGIGRVTLTGTVDTPTTHPVAALRLALAGIGTTGGTAELSFDGPADALRLRLNSALRLASGPARMSADATVNAAQGVMRVAALQMAYDGESVRLLGPARVTLVNGFALENVRLGIGGAVVTADGRVTPALALTLTGRNLTPALAKPFMPGLAATGTVAFDARLTGTVAAPDGTVRVTGRQLRIEGGPGISVPPASLDAHATLSRGAARVDASVTAGNDIRLRLSGTTPMQPTGRLDLAANGALNLALADPLLAANGRTVRGRLTLAAEVTGTPAAPRITGTARLADGGYQDFVQGVRLADITGLLTADGRTLRIAQLTARAGSGTLTAAGTVALAGNMPVDMTITARNARLFASDRLTSTIDANLTVRGAAGGRLNLGGQVTISRADIDIPDTLPQSVAVLNVVRPGRKAQSPPAPERAIGLDLTIVAPGEIFVRGHGLDADLAGRVRITGTSAAPQIGGGFTLRHGTFSIAGQTLTFTSGRVSFSGTGLRSKIDPIIDFVAQSVGSNMVATLTVTGYADAPKITLSSSPTLPQDQILAQLLFGQSVKQLSPFQLAEIGQALASLGGVGGGFDPLGSVRKGLGLDRLSVGSASGTSSGATIQAGKYLTSGIYVGTKQGTSGGTQAQVQIDLTKHLKLETTVGTGGGTPVTGATLQNDPGSSIGLTYQRDY